MVSTAKHDWPMVRLGDVCELQYGKALKKEDRVEGEYRVFGSAGSVGTHVEANFVGPVSVVGRKGSAGFVEWSSENCWIIDTAFGVFPKSEEQVDSRWLYWLLKGLRLGRLQKHAAVPGISKADVVKEEFRLPPLEEQRRIAAILDQASEVISKLEKQLRLLERQDVKVVEKFLASADYPFKALSDVCEVNPVTRFPTGISEEIPFIPMGAVSESGVLACTEWRRMDEVRSGYTRFRKHDVLIAKITPCYENGKSAVATIDADFAAGSTEFHVFRCDANLDPRFLHAVLNSTVVRTTGIANMRGSSGHRRVPAWVFENLRIPLPPIVTQEKLMDSIDEVVEAKSRSVQKQLRSSIELSQSLSTRAFQGEL